MERLIISFVVMTVLTLITGIEGITVTIPMNPKELSSSSPAVYKQINITANSTITVEVTDVPLTFRYIEIGVHTQKKNLTVSEKQFPNGTSISGTNTGLILLLNGAETAGEIWIVNQNGEEVNALIAVVLRLENAPIPGGCNMEFPVEISPFLEIFYNRIKSRVEYQHANIGYPRNMPAPSCDSSVNYLSYDIYVYFLEENEFDENEYFKAITVMTNVSSIHSQARKVTPFESDPKTRVTFLSYPGQGVIYNVVTSYETSTGISEAAYVPAATYGCSFVSKVDGCGQLNGLFAKILMAICAVFGIVLCLFGHRLFKTTIFFFGFLAFSLVSFILLTRYAEMTPLVRSSSTVGCGVVGGLLCAGFWCIFGIYPLTILPVGFVLGFLIMCITYFTPVGGFEILRSDVNYWLILACGVLLVTIILLPCPKALTILSSSIIGSYIAIVMVDRYIHTILSYIVLNVVKRAVVDDLYLASNAFPFQIKDIILTSAWGAFAMFGVCIQAMMQKGQPSVPEAPYSNWRRKPRRRPFYHVQYSSGPTAPSFNRLSSNEQRPLLFDQDRTAYGSIHNPPAS